MIRQYTPRELKLIEQYNTPTKVQQLLNGIDYNFERSGETIKSFRRTMRSPRPKAHCLEGGFVAATLLNEHGWEPNVLVINTVPQPDHVVFIYERHGKLGTVGQSRNSTTKGRRAIFERMEDLVLSYASSMALHGSIVVSFGVVNLDDIPRANWRFSNRNLWKVQEYLNDLKYWRLTTALERVTA